jgi:hypothetical protein
MIDEIGGLRDQPRSILIDGSEHGFDRFLAELLGTIFHAPVEEPARIGGIGARAGALLHALLQIMQGEIRHGYCCISPPDEGGEGRRMRPASEYLTAFAHF